MKSWRQALRRHPRHVDVVLAVTLCALLVTIVLHGMGPDSPHALAALIAVTIACGALVVRRRWPIVVLVLTIGGTEVYLMVPDPSQVVLAAPLIALYTVADRDGWRRALVAGGLAVVVLSLFHTAFRPIDGIWPGNVTLAALGALAVAAGEAARIRRAYATEVEERVRQSERLRIARDLHDVLGHRLALINVQVKVAGHLLDDRPAQARESLDHIRDASSAALEELKATIGLLRRPDSGDGGDGDVPVDPVFGLSQLDELVSSFRRTGLRVECDVAGAVRTVPSAADLTAYRVIQESLTNVSKHAEAETASVLLRYEKERLVITVDDDGQGSRTVDGGAGNGLRGMRERVEAAGGRLRLDSRPGGGFRVWAELPL